jgi:hypothetical protein
MKTLALTLFLIVGTISAAYADCIYNGQSYPTGTILGPYVCSADGTWVRR